MTDRRNFLALCARLGIASTVFTNTLWPQEVKEPPKPTRQQVSEAAALAGLQFNDEQIDAMLEGVQSLEGDYKKIHDLHLANSVSPAFVFDPVLPQDRKRIESAKAPLRVSQLAADDPAKSFRGAMNGRAPKDLEQVCYWNIRQLAELVRTRRVSATALTEMYLERLKRLDAELHCVITLTEERAKAQAAEADKEIAAGRYRGPLHGLPWGAKDLLAVKGYPTTWGAGGFERQQFDEDATVVQRLDGAGAILIAKLTLGALAMGDKWFGGMTRNPWDARQGSSGSSAGPASATAAGCVAFAIGSETLGSISSPSTRCGATGLRPTYGFVPKTGAMALSWTMDKLGPICREVEDCAIVMHAIYGADETDNSVIHDAAFNWDGGSEWRKLRVGYFKDEFEVKAPEEAAKTPPAKNETDVSPEAQKKREEEKKRRQQAYERQKYDAKYGEAAIAKLRGMGVELIAVEVPKFPYGAVTPLLEAEGAAAFDEMTRSGRDKLLTEQGADDWPNIFRTARMYPAVEYVNANRARMLIMQAWRNLFAQVDVIVTPTFSQQLTATNLTGHPAVIVPNGFRGEDALPAIRHDDGTEEPGGPGTPVSLTFLGPLFGDAKALAVAKAYQDATGWQLKHPQL